MTTTITEQVRAAAEEIASMWAFLSHPQTATVRALEAIITKHVHPASLAEPKKLVDEIDDLLSEAIGYDYTNRGPAMIALERLVERNSAPVGPSLTDAIEVVKGLEIPDSTRDGHPLSDAGYNRAIEDAVERLQSLQGKAPVGEREQILDRIIANMPESWRDRWCEPGPMGYGCLGCANGSGNLANFGFTKEEWAASRFRAASTPLSGEVPLGGSENKC